MGWKITKALKWGTELEKESKTRSYSDPEDQLVLYMGCMAIDTLYGLLKLHEKQIVS